MSLPDASGATSRELPPIVRTRVIALSDEALAALPEADVPASLRAVRRFTPAKRIRLGGASIGAALSSEPAFRAAVAAQVRDQLPSIADAVESGTEAPAVPAAELAAVAYLLEAPGWQALVAQAGAANASEASLLGDDDLAHRLRSEVERVRNEARSEQGRLREELASGRREVDELRRKLAKAEGAARRSAQEQAQAEERLSQLEVSRAVLERELSAQVRRLRARLRDVEASAAASRRDTRSEREGGTARLRVLLETVTGAVAGLRRELDLPVGAVRPADGVAEDLAGDTDPTMQPGLLPMLRRGRPADDPALVDDVLAVPGMHLVVDGYNVTKLGYPTITLEDQRGRLISGLAGLVARSPGAEVTCVFDATAATNRPVAAGSPRGLRVLFSATGELADQLIVRLVAAEPTGRPVVVITNDREVVEAVRRAGGESLGSAALLGRLERS